VLRRESSDAETQQKSRQAELDALIQTLSVDVNVASAATQP
jgi:hypothetical protein